MPYTIKINDIGTTEFSPHLLFKKDTKYEIALVHGLIPRSWYNISSALGNNTYTFAGVPYTVEDGTYDLDSLLEQMAIPALDFIGVRHSGKVKVVNGTASDLVLEGLAPVLGFTNPTTITAGTTLTSPNIADFTGGVKEVEIHCNLVERKYSRHQGRSSDILRGVVVDAQPLNHIDATRGVIQYLPMINTETLSQIKIELKDQSGRDIDINGFSAEFTINIKSV